MRETDKKTHKQTNLDLEEELFKRSTTFPRTSVIKPKRDDRWNIQMVTIPKTFAQERRKQEVFHDQEKNLFNSSLSTLRFPPMPKTIKERVEERFKNTKGEGVYKRSPSLSKTSMTCTKPATGLSEERSEQH